MWSILTKSCLWKLLTLQGIFKFAKFVSAVDRAEINCQLCGLNKLPCLNSLPYCLQGILELSLLVSTLDSALLP